MTKRLKIMFALAAVGGAFLPGASAGLAPGNPTISTPAGNRGHGGGTWWDWVASGEKPRRGGVASHHDSEGLFGQGPLGQNWQRPGNTNPGNHDNPPPQGPQNSSTLFDDDPPPDDDGDLPPENDPTNEEDPPILLQNYFGDTPPQGDGPYREPRPVPAPGALALGLLGLAIVHRYQR